MEDFPVGTRVVITGLVSKPKLNGQLAVVMEAGDEEVRIILFSLFRFFVYQKIILYFPRNELVWFNWEELK